ncbi:MAG: hypothetical protein ABIJ09_07475 [Pseudomonadota bacterium]
MMRRTQKNTALAHLMVLAALAAACDPAAAPCYGDSQCPAGQVCDPRGQCVAAVEIDAGALDASASDRAGVDQRTPDAGHDDASTDAAAPDATLDDGGAPLCPPWDQVITRSEMNLGPGLSGHFRAIAPDQPVTVNLVPTQTSGGLLWDFSAAASGEHSVVLETLSPAGTWWAADYPDASYANLLQIGGDVLGVFRVDSDQVVMLGVVSVDADRIDLSYDPPVVVYRFPLQVGDSWVTESTVTGIYEGVLTGFYEDYSYSVEVAGQARVPAGTFDVLQLRMERVNRVPTLNPFFFLTTTTLKYQFVAQCYGTVAVVGSQDDEDADPFTTAREYTRLGF